MRKNMKKIICLALVLSLCGVMGVRHFYNPQEPVVIETVSDTLETAGAVQAEESKNANLNLDVKAAVLWTQRQVRFFINRVHTRSFLPASVTKSHDPCFWPWRR